MAWFFLAQVFPEIFTVLVANIILYINEDAVGLLITLGGIVTFVTLFMVPFIRVQDIILRPKLSPDDEATDTESTDTH